MYPDFKELLSVFNEEQVKYLIVGAYAVGVHAQPRATKDLDLLVKPDAENAEAVFRALARFGAPLEGLTSADFAESGPFFRMGHPPISVDILTSISGIDFDQAWANRIEDVIDGETGLRANFISAEDLVTAKLAAGRLQDLADVDAIQKAQRLRPQKVTSTSEASNTDPAQ